MGNVESVQSQQPDESVEGASGDNSEETSNDSSLEMTNRVRLDSAKTTTDDDYWWSQLENEEFVLNSTPSDLVSNSPEDLTKESTSSVKDIQQSSLTLQEDSEASYYPKQSKNDNDYPTSSSLEENSKNIDENENKVKTNQRAREQSLEEFKEELRVKRLARQTAVQDLRDEIITLRQQLANEQALTRSLRGIEDSDSNGSNDASSLKQNPSEDNLKALNTSHSHHDSAKKEVKENEEHSHAVENGKDANAYEDADDDADDVDPLSRSRHANIELANAQLALQLSQAENLSLRTELGVVQKQVGTLKEVVSCCKQMLAVKEEQCDQLKAKLQEIETSFNENEMKIMSSKLREEYERQLQNIRQLRQLYEERQRIANAEHENLQRLIAIKKDELKAEQVKMQSYEERNQTLVKEVENANIELATLREECNEHKFEKKALKEEMGAVNTLFTQMVMGFNGKNNLDIDRLTAMLEENRALLNEMTTKEANCSDGATLPKLLFELVEQAAVVDKTNTSCSLTPTLNVSEDDDDGDGEADGDADADVDGDCVDDNDVEGDVDGDAVPDSDADADMVAAEVNDNVADANMMDVTDCVKHQAQISNNKELNNEDGASTSTKAIANSNAASIELSASSSSSSSLVNVSASNSNEALSMAPIKESSSTLAKDFNATVLASIPVGASSEAGLATSSTASASVNIQKNMKKHFKRNNAGKKNKISSVANPSSTTIGTTTLKFNEPEVMGKVASAQEIIGNLPKVWKVLMELLSHHKIEKVQFEENGMGEDCYKSPETTNNGAKPELSVSKTYIKLKDLILEKKSLVKETTRLKTLNSHLEYRLNEQEKRLSTVSLELTKTWHLVGKMQRQHRQLHTQEQILRYQLQQKRRLLSELKDELEYCRRKWAAARAKNDESQEQCNDLRREFAQRKLEDANHSAESGYSDSGQQSDEEERNNESVATIPKLTDKKDEIINIEDDVEIGEDEVEAGAVAMAAAVAACSHVMTGISSVGNSRRKNLREMFEHTRKIKRMQSSSPGRCAAAAAAAAAAEADAALRPEEDSSNEANDKEEIVLRWNSAPPTCGWREGGDDDEEEEQMRIVTPSSSNRGAIPKAKDHNSRAKQHSKKGCEQAKDLYVDEDSSETAETACRILRLEEQCKSLIQKVLETSDNRERLEVQLCKFQDEIAPVQYAVPLDEFINKRRLERMTRASSAPVTGSGCLTPREEEYTRKRSDRLERLEEESRQLMSRIKRTSDRGHYLRCSLDRIRRGPPREESFESNTEEDLPKLDENKNDIQKENDEDSNDVAQEIDSPPQSESETIEKSPLTAAEEEYTARRTARLRRLEEEGRELMSRLSRNVERTGSLEQKINNLHQRFGEQEPEPSTSHSEETSQIEKRLEDIHQISENRERRLRILEEEGKELLSRLTKTSDRGTQMINRIAERERNSQRKASPSVENNSALEAGETAGSTTVLLPTPNTVACSSIVDEELSDSVMVTTTSTQIAAQHGAIPKSKPQAELSVFARAKQLKVSSESSESNKAETESLQDMIKRLQELPFPSNDSPEENKSSEEAEVQAKSDETNIEVPSADESEAEK